MRLSLTVAVALLAAATPAVAQGKLEWHPNVLQALEDAGAQNRVVFLSLGLAAEPRSEAILKDGLGDKLVAAQAATTINVAAWTWLDGMEKKLRNFGKLEAFDHSANFAEISSRWLVPNDREAVALPQHLWLNSKGEILLSVPFELDTDELSWCFDEAMRRAGITERPAMSAEARPPRRLLTGEAFRLPTGDSWGRGLMDKEFERMIDGLKKEWFTFSQREEVGRILFTPSKDAVEYIGKQLPSWEFGDDQSAQLVDRSIDTIGELSPIEFIDVLAEYADADRPRRRASVAVALEQMGSSEGLSVAKKALKKEKDETVRPEWVRALGACGKRDGSVAKTLIKLADKEKSARMRYNAVLALGHVLPQDAAWEFLAEVASEPRDPRRVAAILAFGLGRSERARPLLESLREGAEDPVADAITRSLQVLDGAGLAALEKAIQALDGSEYNRKRLYFRSTRPPSEDDEDSDSSDDE